MVIRITDRPMTSAVYGGRKATKNQINKTYYHKSSNRRPGLYFTERGMGVYKRLECSQSIFEKPKHSVCIITSVPCL